MLMQPIIYMFRYLVNYVGGGGAGYGLLGAGEFFLGLCLNQLIYYSKVIQNVLTIY
jgi:hypothetical protein